jgi:hypothetical protein
MLFNSEFRALSAQVAERGHETIRFIAAERHRYFL